MLFIRKVGGILLAASSVLILVGCETEQPSSKNNDAMVGYAQDQAKAQAEFANQEQLKKSPLTQAKVVTDGTTQTLNEQK